MTEVFDANEYYATLDFIGVLDEFSVAASSDTYDHDYTPAQAHLECMMPGCSWSQNITSTRLSDVVPEATEHWNRAHS